MTYQASVYTPEVMNKLRRLKSNGVPNDIIAEVINSTPGSVAQTCHRLRIRRHDGYIGANVGDHVATIWRDEAERRGVHLSRLVEEVLEAVARGYLFAAVLDKD